MSKILIVYATAGIGHKKAAVAVKKALDEIAPAGTEVTLIDALDYTPKFFKWSYLQLYLLAVNKLSSVWGFMYYLTDNFYANILVSRIRRLNNWMNSRRFEEYLKSSKPDAILSTHFFASEVAGCMIKKGALNSRLITVITDYRLHSWWVSACIDAYVVSSKDAEADLLRWGVAPSKIKVLGIPAEPVFSRPLDKNAIYDKFGLKRGVFTILVIGGGFGVGPIEGIVKAIGGVSGQVQVIVVCGHNDDLVKKITSLKDILKIDIKTLGFIDNVYEYMEIANILISKSGGITVTESLDKELPMIVISPIPGQETRNSDFILNHGAAIKIEKAEELKNVIEDLMANPGKIQKMKESIRKIRMPYASYDIAKLALESAKENKA